MDEHSEVVLAHYGVKGMKWGVRKKAGNVVREARKGLKEAAVEKKVADRDAFKALRDKDNLNVTGKAINVTNRLTMGRKFTEKYYNAQIKGLDKQIESLSTGKASTLSKIDAVLDLRTSALKVQKKS